MLVGIEHPLRMGIVLLLCVALFAGGSLGECQEADSSEAAERASTSLPATYTTVVAKQAGEDLAGPCTYDLYLAQPGNLVRGVLVIFDRADTNLLYLDPGVRQLAFDLNLALLFPLQCNAASFNNIQPDAAKGPGRALFTSLAQLAAVTHHPELKEAALLLYGFSAAGILSTTLTNLDPERIIGVIGYAAASPNEKLDWIVASTATLQVPFLLLSNAEDLQAGTQHDETFFNRGWAAGAPWGWAVQNKTGHCCNLSTRPIILPWIKAVVAQRLSNGGGLRPILQTRTSAGRFASFTCTRDGKYDNTGNENCRFAGVTLRAPGMSRATASTWLPDEATAEQWLKWTTN